MDKVVLATRLVELSRESARKSMTASEKKVVARKMVGLAREVVGLNMTPDLEASVKATEKLATQFKDAHVDLITEINDMEKKLKDKQDVLKAYFKDWATKSGYKAVRAELLDLAVTCMSIGDTLDAMADGMKVLKRESEQESFKEKYNVLVSMLNPAELAKYSRLLNLYYNKVITELKTGLKMMDDDLKDWQDEAKALAEERGMKLPKASVRSAGMFGDMVDSMGSAISELVRRVEDFFSGLMTRVERHGDELTDLEMKVKRMLAEAEAKGAF